MQTICQEPAAPHSESRDSDRQLNSHESSYDAHTRNGQACFRWVIALSAGLLLALAGPFLAGRIYTADDLGAFHLPMRAFYADCLAHGESFDWSPQMYCGFYLTGEGQIGGYHPLHLLLYRFLPLPLAFDLECLLSYPFMLAGLYFLLRQWGLRRDAALFGGLTFTFSGFSLLHFMHLNGVAVVAHWPWLLLAIHAVLCGNVRYRRLLGGVAIALLTGSQLLLGYPQYVWLSLLVELGYVALLMSRSRLPDGICDRVEACERSRSAGGTYWVAGLWLALGLILGAIQWLPTLDALWHSSRAAAGRDFTGWGSLDPLNIVQLVAPYLFRSRVVGQNTHELGIYAGAVTLILAACCLINRPNGGRMRVLRRGAILLVIGGLLLAFGNNGPLGWIVARLPLVSSFRFPCRAIVLVHFGMAVLAAIGLVSLQVRFRLSNGAVGGRGWTEGKPRRAPPDIKVCCAIAAMSLLLAIAGPILWPDYVSSPALVWVGPGLIALATVLVVFAYRRASWAMPALMLLSALDLGAYGMSYAVYPQSVNFDEYLATIPVPPGPPSQRLALDLLAANRSGLHAGNQLLLRNYERADGYAGLEPSRQLDYRQTAALRVAGVGLVAPTADFADLAPSTSQSTDWLQLEALPRARLVTKSKASADPSHDILEIPVESEALVQQQLVLDPAPGGTTKIIADHPGEIRVEVDAPGRQLLVLAESFHSGWSATANRKPVSIVRVNGDFMGCIVEPGRSEIHFEFHPSSLWYGRLLSILGLGLIGVILLGATLTGSLKSSSEHGSALPR